MASLSIYSVDSFLFRELVSTHARTTPDELTVAEHQDSEQAPHRIATHDPRSYVAKRTAKGREDDIRELVDALTVEKW